MSEKRKYILIRSVSRPNEPCYDIVIEHSRGFTYVGELSPRYAQDVLLAVNAHEPLVEALKELKIETCFKCEGTGESKIYKGDSCAICGGQTKIITYGNIGAIEEALKLAEVKS